MSDAFEIDFGRAGGGLRCFNDVSELQAHIASEQTAWTSLPGWQLSGRAQQGQANQAFSEITGRWSRLAIPPQPGRQTIDAAGTRSVVLNNISQKPPLSVRSAEGRALAHVISTMEPASAGGAAMYVMAKPTEQLPTFNRVQMDGALAWHDMATGLADPDTSHARAAIVALKSDLERDAIEHRSQLAQMEERHLEALRELERLRAGDREALDVYREQTKEAVDQQRAGWQAQWDEVFEAFTERLRLESAVKLWSDRSGVSRLAAAAGRRWATCIGSSGLIAAGGVAWGSFDFAHWLFAGAVVRPASAGEAGLRPTFHFELLFAAAATLLYLTMFLWIMRLVVRGYMTQQHLAIDAESRASMAETYLALIKDGAATDDDRKIVLASLFRPVVDGIVKDDAMPALTPAALLSGMVGGKA